jgi:exonuclease III
VARNISGKYIFLYGKRNDNHELGTAVKRVQFDSARMSCIILSGPLCHIFVLNDHTPTEDETDDVKDSFYEELERVFDKFPKYHTKILLGDFNAKVDRQDTFKPTNGNVSLHENSNYNGYRLVIFATFNTSESKVRCSHIATSINVSSWENPHSD